MNDASTYIIAGGDAGAERLRVLSAAMRGGTGALLDRIGIRPGMSVLDAGCGGGEVALEIARRVGPSGRVVGIEMDERVLEHARAASAADASGLCAVEWRAGRVEDLAESAAFDVVYSRFLLSHLGNPADAIRRMRRALRPGGLLVAEDIDITVHTCWPPSDAFRRYVALYADTARARGADPSIGPRLPAMFAAAGLADVDVFISMPVFLEGEGKTIARRTLANIAGAAIASGLTDRAEADELLAALADHEAEPGSIQSTAQVFQVTGRRPAALPQE